MYNLYQKRKKDYASATYRRESGTKTELKKSQHKMHVLKSIGQL